MAKLIAQHDTDPGIAIVLTYTAPNDPTHAVGWHGSCTECGRPMHRWDWRRALESAQAHVDSHDSAL